MGAVGMADMLVLVIISDAAQNAMAGEYKTVTDGFILVGTIIAWNYAVRLGSLPLPLRWSGCSSRRRCCSSQDGRVLWRNLRAELVSRRRS